MESMAFGLPCGDESGVSSHRVGLVGVGVYFFRDDDGVIRHSTVSPWTR